MSPPKSVGFIGLGIMGYPMCVSLFKKSTDTQSLYIYDISTETLSKLQSETSTTRVHICSSSKEVAERSDVIFTMVPEGSHVRAVYLEPENGILSTDLASKILVDCSTIDTATSSLVREQIINQFPTATFYDAPVSGGSLGAAKASLTFMLGASKTDPNITLLNQMLGTMGKFIFPCGGSSLGLTAKLCNNYCSGLIAIATAEAMNIGIKSGIDPRVLATIFSTSTAQSTISDTWNPVPGVCPGAPSSNDYQGGFKVQLMKKDFGLAVDAAERIGAKLVLGDAGLETYQAASKDPNCMDRDSRVVFRYLGGDENWAAKFEK
ncbi:putative 3-hydroxyisobutyrate dehydrogenase, mitochondrial [Lachnellula subtilissima]|uniref:3-hydroxyisobutyrate dehydrogenase n=1 Tax=Lachnellula subtilissima TaxID=602034 RepID=A0A8H8S5H0_9HELO|nr:putative 3-hydroxyisobutyrate dehydrogenase, mitochondrial [Lachnellula subtilissima]